MSETNARKNETAKRLTPAELLERAQERNTGPVAWRRWKEAETREILELAERADRMELLDVSFEGDLNVAYRVRMPVPRWPENGELRIGEEAGVFLNYRENWRYEAPAGWEPLGVFHPLDLWHPNCSAVPALRGSICLGLLPPGVDPKELILLGYYALTLQDLVLDETDPHGVLNLAACEYYRNHPQHVPLTRAGLFDPWEPARKESEVTA